MGKKKVGGVRVISPVPPPPSRQSRKQGKRKVGGVTRQEAGTSSAHRAPWGCCDGFLERGNWQHTVGCRFTQARLRSAGATLLNWECPYGCEGTETPNWITHKWDCRYWSEEGRYYTPF